MVQTEHRIPILDPAAELAALWEELLPAVIAVLKSGEYILGGQVRAFEAAVADYLGVRHAIGVNSGTDALVIALRALGIGPGDEVITTPFTFFATAEAIGAVGAEAVFVDIDPATFNLDPARVEAAITARTRAILPVHLYGQAADMEALMGLAAAYGLHVLEDVAQAMGGAYGGRKLGSFGSAGAFSFFPSKNLGGCGDGGLVTTDDDDVAELARMLRAHGARKKYHNERLGYNSRLDELQAAILNVKLPRLDACNQARREVARRYRVLLSGLPGLVLPEEAPGAQHVYHQYTVRLPAGRRDAVAQALAADGIGTMVYYPVPVHRLPLYAGRAPSLPVAEQASREVLSLPIGPMLAEADQERVARSLGHAL